MRHAHAGRGKLAAIKTRAEDAPGKPSNVDLVSRNGLHMLDRNLSLMSHRCMFVSSA